MDKATNSQIVARIDTPLSLAARLPRLGDIAHVGRLQGWTTHTSETLMTRLRGAVIRAVSSRDENKVSLRELLSNRLSGVLGTELPRQAAAVRREAVKSWAAEHADDPLGLEVLCECKEAELDGSTVSLMLNSVARFDETPKSRLLAALAERVLEWNTALAIPDSVSRFLGFASSLPWHSPAHEDIAWGVVKLSAELDVELTMDERQVFEERIGSSLLEKVRYYAAHPRVSVVEQVAKFSTDAAVLVGIGDRAELLRAVDPRLMHRLVTALAQNGHTPTDVLDGFARAPLWTQNSGEQQSLDALLARAFKRAPQHRVDLVADAAPHA